MENLYQSGGISLQEFENTRPQLEVSRANWQAVQRAVEVKAPISGTITRINVQETDNVQPGDNLFTVSQTRKLKARLWVSEKQIASIQKSDKAVALWQGIELSGSVAQVDLSMDSKKQAFGVVVEFSNGDQKVKSGVNAQIQIKSAEIVTGILVERKNVTRLGDQLFVHVISDDIAHIRTVETGRDLGLDLEVTSGLELGEQLVTQGQLLLKEGDKVRVIN